MKLVWIANYYIIACPWIFLWGGARATRYHAWSWNKAWTPTADLEDRRLEVWDLLRQAEGAAERSGYDDLAESLSLVSMLWAAGFEDRARQALAGAAGPLPAGLEGDSAEGTVREWLGDEDDSPRECCHGKLIGDDCGLCELQGPDRPEPAIWEPSRVVERFEVLHGTLFTVECESGFSRSIGSLVRLGGQVWKVLGWDDHKMAGGPRDGEVIVLRVAPWIEAEEDDMWNRKAEEAWAKFRAVLSVHEDLRKRGEK